MTVAIVTDSNAQLPEALRNRFDVRVVPLTVVVGGEAFREGVDLTTDDFYARLGRGSSVTTSAPSPGELVGEYDAAAAAGATQIVSVHVGSNTSATVNAATVAARTARVPVEIVDTGTASFAVACCVWAAGDALGRGATATEAADAARSTAADVNNVFIVGALDLARAGGRLGAGIDDVAATPVLALANGAMRAVAHVEDVASAIDAMVEYFVAAAAGRPQRVGVGDATTPEVADALAAALGARPEVTDLVRYRIGPSVGAHTGPGTIGTCFFPA